jgi:YVTN family beta-propeller protein
MRMVRPVARGACAVLSLSLLVGALLTVTPAAVNAATVTSSLSARIGSAGANGAATIQTYTTGAGSLRLKLRKLPASTSLAVTIRKGTCALVGTMLLKFPTIKSSGSGTAARTISVTVAQAGAISTATSGSGRLAIRVGTGKAAKCGLLTRLPVPPYVAATITVGRSPSGVAVAPSGVWVTNWFDNTISRVDPATNGVLQTMPLVLTGTAGPEAIAYGDGSLWVTVTDSDANGNPLAGSVLRLDPASGQVQATIAVGRSPFSIEVTPTAVWVPAYADNTLARIDPATNGLVTTIPVCTKPAGVTSGFGAVWASCWDGSVARIDPATNAVVTTIKTQDSGGYVVASGTAIWVTNAGHENTPDGSVTRIDPATNKVVANAVLGLHPEEIAYAGGSLWIGLADTPTVVRVSATTNAVLARISVAAPVFAIAATDRSVWAVHRLGAPDANSDTPLGTVTRINYGLSTFTPPHPSPTPTPTPTPSAPSDAELEAACPNGTAIAESDPYSGTIHPIGVVYGDVSGRWYVYSTFPSRAPINLPYWIHPVLHVGPVQLVICVGFPTEVKVDSCGSYTRTSDGTVGEVIRYKQTMTVQVIVAATGKNLETNVFYGSIPDCANTVSLPISGPPWAIYGGDVDYKAVNSWIDGVSTRPA